MTPYIIFIIPFIEPILIKFRALSSFIKCLGGGYVFMPISATLEATTGLVAKEKVQIEF